MHIYIHISVYIIPLPLRHFPVLQVTPRSVPFLRKIANDVVMDVLFYTQVRRYRE